MEHTDPGTPDPWDAGPWDAGPAGPGGVAGPFPRAAEVSAGAGMSLPGLWPVP